MVDIRGDDVSGSVDDSDSDVLSFSDEDSDFDNYQLDYNLYDYSSFYETASESNDTDKIEGKSQNNRSAEAVADGRKRRRYVTHFLRF